MGHLAFVDEKNAIPPFLCNKPRHVVSPNSPVPLPSRPAIIVTGPLEPGKVANKHWRMTCTVEERYLRKTIGSVPAYAISSKNTTYNLEFVYQG